MGSAYSSTQIHVGVWRSDAYRPNLFCNSLLIQLSMHHYNTTQDGLILRAYGRHVQKLVNALSRMEDTQRRTQEAQRIVQLMGMLEGGGKNCVETTQKHWEALFAIANQELDIESPCAIVRKTATAPSPLHYARDSVRYRRYGRGLEKLMRQAVTLESQTEREEMVLHALYLMRNIHTEGTQDKPDTDEMLAQLERMSAGTLNVDAEKIKLRYAAHTALRKGKSKTGRKFIENRSKRVSR